MPCIIDKESGIISVIKFRRKEGIINEKMLVKAVALSLVLGGVGFVGNNAQAAGPIPGMPSETDIMKANIKANGLKIEQNKAAIQDIKGDVATNKANITKNANDISDNKIAIQKEEAARKSDIAMTNFKAGLEKQERENADKKLEQKIDKNATDILVEKKNRESAVAMVDNKVNLEKQERENNDAKLDAKIDKETSDRKFGEFKLNTKIDAEGQARVAGDELLNKKIEKETKDREFGEFKLNTKIDAEGQARVAGDELLNKKIDTEIDDRKAEVSRLDGRIDKLDANVEKVGAMAAAIANLHTMGYDPEAPTEIAVGVGQYRDKTGLALGAFHYPNRDFMLSFSVSTAGDEFMGGIGATWKFGRKSPEELRQAEAEKAAKAKLAKAEAAKKAAKDARVAAQQKRHAEMLAARTGK